MKRLFAITLMVLLTFGITFPIAQETDLENIDLSGSTPIINDDDLDVSLSHESPDPATKEFLLVAHIKSEIDSGKVLVNWNLPPQIELAIENATSVSRTQLNPGDRKQITKRVKALHQGVYEVEVTVTAIKADFYYLSTDNFEIEFNEDLEIIPYSDEYKQAKNIRTAGYTVLYALIGVVMVGTSIFLFLRIRKWRDEA